MDSSTEQTNSSQPTDEQRKTDGEKVGSMMSDIYMHECRDDESKEEINRSFPEKLFTFSRIVLYIILGLSILEPIQSLRSSENPSQGMIPIVIFPLLIFLHMRLVEKVQSQFANGKDYLVGGILLLFVAFVILLLSLFLSFPLAIIKLLGVLVAIVHVVFAFEVLSRYK